MKQEIIDWWNQLPKERQDEIVDGTLEIDEVYYSELRNCAFQYAKMKYGQTEVICDKECLTISEAKQLWDDHYIDCAKHINNGHTCEMVIWIDMSQAGSYCKTLQHISYNAESDGAMIWETKREYFPKYFSK